MAGAIRLEGIGKRYRLGETHSRYATLRETIMDGIKNAGADRSNRNPTEFWALRDASFTMDQGEVLGIIGRNGAGKSTLLKILSRVTTPTTGTARIAGRVGTLLEVGSGFHNELTGRENIMLNGSILGMRQDEIRRRFDSIVEFADIGPFLDTPVKRYSSGMYVRLAFAVAAHLESEVMIIDEVLAVGDAQFQKRCLGKLAEVGSSGRTVLFVSHNMAAVQALCTRAILLEAGAVVADGLPGEIAHRYLGGSSSQPAERHWEPQDAPQAQGIALLSVRLLGGDGFPRSRVDMSEDFEVVIEYSVEAEGTRVGLTLTLLNEDGVQVLSSINNHESEWHHKPRAAGRYVSTCTLPKHLLNNGRHRVGVILWRDEYQLVLHEHDVVQFDVMDDGADRADYMYGYDGIVRPWLPWHTHKEAETE